MINVITICRFIGKFPVYNKFGINLLGILDVVIVKWKSENGKREVVLGERKGGMYAFIGCCGCYAVFPLTLTLKGG
jgi:hypothetical protein